MRAVKVEVHIQPLYFFRAQSRRILFDQALDVFRGQAEYKAETQGRTFAPDDMQAVFADIFPVGIFRQLRVCVKESFLDEAVNAECIKSHDLSFYEAETVESVFQKKL